ncbi:hypothetical protein [Streptomyces sp. NPDC004008]
MVRRSFAYRHASATAREETGQGGDGQEADAHAREGEAPAGAREQAAEEGDGEVRILPKYVGKQHKPTKFVVYTSFPLPKG